MQKIGILGSGVVGTTLASGFLKHGYGVMIGSRNPQKLSDWQQQNPGGQLGTFEEAAAFGQTLVLAVVGHAAEEALTQAGGAHLSGKTILDATNPIAKEPPVDGVLKFFTDLNESLMEKLQNRFPEARFVKVFNSVGSALMVNPQLPGGKPTMFIAGNDEGARQEVTQILDQFGWETSDLGRATAARAIEPLCMLWCIPGFLQNDWMHAYKVLKMA
ncbi:NADPH-dependent F420 reductase [Tellurirhabdus rosea]|uniref:NADPH-dependent F420 reductase n=1 Tax=Tellurirhabdus rosea TaxID=2674997 RepID=UPI002255A14D|nr:NAD(P)-binding domain-containing protein [Tellurirhabdus rosea]